MARPDSFELDELDPDKLKVTISVMWQYSCVGNYGFV